jgi:hypothetical protein
LLLAHGASAVFFCAGEGRGECAPSAAFLRRLDALQARAKLALSAARPRIVRYDSQTLAARPRRLIFLRFFDVNIDGIRLPEP